MIARLIAAAIVAAFLFLVIGVGLARLSDHLLIPHGDMAVGVFLGLTFSQLARRIFSHG